MSSFFKSRVENYIAKTPIRFRNRNDSSKSINVPEILQNSIEEFQSNYQFYINPILSSGHTQTAYTAINKFENQHHVYYKRKIITIENKTYKIPNTNDFLKYDQWQGESTIAIDFAIPKEKASDDIFKFKPESQLSELPPRTEFADPKEEIIENNDEKPLLIVLHGLSGGSYEAYIRAVLEKIISDEYNFDAIVLNSRGCAKHTITSPQLYNGLWTNDLRYLINEIVTKKYSKKRVYLMGFSLGGAILANYLGQEGQYISNQIKGACCFGTPWDFPDGAIHLRESIIGHKIYSPTMCSNLLKLLNSHGILENNQFIEEYKNNPSNYNIKFLKQFDDFFTSKLFGLNCADEYYRLASPIQRVLKVRVPLLIISSKDDPITGCRSLPYAETNLNPYITMITTTIGGHLGWFTWNGDRWYTKPICQFFKNLNEYDVDKQSIEEKDLPMDISKSWKFDRLINGMLE
ncbi:unnamed protein product [Candida verbasci]|uniref:AB hydrolase-1 domain-containing protein n=1 Tax=Candida verbasci TaxID=1227364 RepID=A0A9W4TYC6_9ASCO|nr:unnamed protein product [Candida verbasci]